MCGVLSFNGFIAVSYISGSLDVRHPFPRTVELKKSLTFSSSSLRVGAIFQESGPIYGERVELRVRVETIRAGSLMQSAASSNYYHFLWQE